MISNPQDIVVLRTPPWWTMRHTLILLGGLSFGLLFAWVWSKSLRSHVQAQTAVIREHQKELMTLSHQAGMAEVAVAVLHNVGNVLNSVNVSANLVSEKLRGSRIGNVSLVAGMMKGHAADLGDFVTLDAKGRCLPSYLTELGEHLAEENCAVLGELDQLTNSIQHIKDIVAMQQTYASFGGMTETATVTDLIEDALRMNVSALERHDVDLVRDYGVAGSAEIVVEKHKVLQILVNLVSNAKYACAESGKPDSRLAIRVTNGDGRVKMSFADNGAGIRGENLARIFTHGFTTRKHGHGFGLHSAALAAQQMGGSLSVHSDGPGLGATFILELPKSPKKNEL
jgi:signal transduction histidine kinase